MKPGKAKALTLLKQQLEPIAKLKTSPRDPEFDKWWEMTRTIIANLFGHESLQLANFAYISYIPKFYSSSTPESAWHRVHVSGLETAEAQLEALISEVTNFWSDEAAPAEPSYDMNLATIFERLPGRFYCVAPNVGVRLQLIFSSDERPRSDFR
jgi:hypothetical protein